MSTRSMTRGIHCVRIAVAGLVSAALAAPARADHKAVAWRHDFAAAVAESRSSRKPLLVVAHRIGDAGCEPMVKSVYEHRRFRKAVRNFVPFVLCYFDESDARTATTRFGFPDPETLARARDDGHRALFGPNTAVAAPQHLILHPDRGVLWHSTFQCSLSELLNGMALARREFRKSSRARLPRLRADASRLAKRAVSNADALFRLSVLVAHATEAQFRGILHAIQAAHEVCERVLAKLAATLPPDQAKKRLLVAAPIVGKKIVDPLLERFRAKPEPVTTPGPRRASKPGAPPRSLGRVTHVDGCRLPTEIEDALRGKPGRVTVLWFYNPKDASLGRQRMALSGVVKELSQRGVRFIGLACGLRIPASDAGRTNGLGFACHTYRYRAAHALGDVRWFPSAVVLDKDGNVAYRTAQTATGMAPGYARFAEVVRRLLAADGRCAR